MKKYWIAPLLALTLGAFGCGNDAEKDQKIKELENRLARLESSRTPVANPNLQAAQPQQTAVTSGNITNITFDQSVYDFGTVPEGTVVKHTFTFTNTGDKDLIISNASASCGCTVPDWSKNPIKPGEKGEIKVEFNSTGKPNQQSPIVTVTSNTAPAVNRLSVKGFVTPRNSQIQTTGPVKR
ncbi:DUF1573 domain-containing protein [Penaeicola halotolerans]|uniref:DUF1573 domain-containing protein n=1 Tax=Penaeicola halotolerans TaxID=2793196 RepID=UPI001CF8344D|nr:DUF1573 domain-containing protein [Penaeicola halotolerans]